MLFLALLFSSFASGALVNMCPNGLMQACNVYCTLGDSNQLNQCCYSNGYTGNGFCYGGYAFCEGELLNTGNFPIGQGVQPSTYSYPYYYTASSPSGADFTTFKKIIICFCVFAFIL